MLEGAPLTEELQRHFPKGQGDTLAQAPRAWGGELLGEGLSGDPLDLETSRDLGS